MRKELRNTKGITLVALIITIIVLLILAMVSIRLVMNGGIISRAQRGTEAYTIAEEKEQIQLGYQKYQMSKYTDAMPTLTVEGAQSNGDETNGWDIVFPSNNQYHLDKDGNITGPTTSNANVSTGPVTNPYGENDWEYAYTCTNGTWSELITKGNTAEGDIVAKFYKQDTLVTPSYSDIDISMSFPENNSYHLIIEGTGQMGPLVQGDNIADAVGWNTLLINYYVKYRQTGNMPTDIIPIMQYVTDIYVCDGVTSIGTGAFYFGILINNTNISSTVTSIGKDAFFNCISLSDITIPNSVTTLGGFSGCTNLSSITIPNSVTTIGNNAFSGCTSLDNITIPNSVTSIGDHAFSDCTSLSNITIPNSLTTIGNNAFLDCTSLSNITIPNSVTTLEDYAFSGCTSLSNITIPNSVTTIGEYVFVNCTGLSSVSLENGITSIGDSMFYSCTNLRTITIPNSVTIIKQFAFCYCTSLSSITIPNSVTEVETGAFNEWTQEQTINIRKKESETLVNGVRKYNLSNCDAVINWNYQGE